MEQKAVNPKNIENVQKLTERLDEAKAIVLVDYKGISVQEDTDLRSKFRDNKVDYFVAKNTLLKLAAKELSIEGLDEYLVGPTAVAVSKEDEVTPPKMISDFMKNLPDEKDFFKFKVGIIDNQLMDVHELEKIVNLPSKQELLAKVVRSFNSPISGLVYTLNSILQKLVLVLNEIKNKQQS
ncbi:50S ribosomal protein L10 [bacterium]|jgi:Ribosomal protein L10|nr:50S ribosomal protein L10 [Candidatus Celaenobacter polaris]TSA27159.1 MAG: 50S ribosomal protein L10 [bacterium]